MPRNRKLFVNKTAIFVTSRVEEGLPFVALSFINLIVWGILARAQRLHEVKVCHFVFMANHFHFLLVVDNPDHVAGFIRYIKVETSHAINRLLGRRKRTIWCDGYDSPVLLTMEDVQRYISYIYVNPIRAKLVRKVSDYPGVSSWELYQSSSRTTICMAVRRGAIAAVPRGSFTSRQQNHLVKLLSCDAAPIQFTLEPDAWVECFQDHEQNLIEAAIKANAAIRLEIASEESRYSHIKVVGRMRLQSEMLNRPYSPSTFSRRMICICSDQGSRREFIAWYRGLVDIANSVYLQWKKGDFSSRLPAGFLAPGNFLLSNLLSTNLLS